jgi:mannose-6-phosphate isomerase-like protein (cupin superfamily)
VISGSGRATVDGEVHELTAGCTLIVPSDVDFALENAGSGPFEAIALMPVGGAARIGTNAPFTPPWAI